MNLIISIVSLIKCLISILIHKLKKGNTITTKIFFVKLDKIDIFYCRKDSKI